VVEGWQVVQGYPPAPPRPNGGGPRNGLGAVTFVVVLLGALLAVIPASAGLGFVLCVLAIIPAVVAYQRTRKGAATNRRRSLAAVAMAPAFVVVAVVVGSATAPLTTGGVGTAARELPDRSVAATGQPLPSAAPVDSAAPTPPSGAAAPVAAGVRDSARVAGSAPRAATTTRPGRATAAPPVRAVAPKPAPKPASAGGTGGACNETTHYVNVSGNCVLLPVAAATAPAGASAQCADGTYSSSQHRSGTCSHHGGVQRWLKNLPG
jgi:hypothetical protein